MPELPEVENLRLGLEKSIPGQQILKIEVGKAKIVSGKGTIRHASMKKQIEFTKGLTGERFKHIERRAKNLIFKLSHEKSILAHLKMTGQFIYQPKNHKLKKVIGGHPSEIAEKTLPNKHTHIIFYLDKGTLYYNDIRKFGYVIYYKNMEDFEKENHFKDYGAEPLDKNFTLKYFEESLKNKKGKIKTILMNQDIVAGIGNIYADESLFKAGIDPRRSASTLKREEIKKLRQAIISILKRAVSVGGSSVATYRLLDQSEGNYAREHKVYGKKGQNCPKCGRPLAHTLIQTRTTIFCSHCQK